MDFVELYPKMSHLLKKLAFTDVYILVSNNQVTLLHISSLDLSSALTKQNKVLSFKSTVQF